MQIGFFGFLIGLLGISVLVTALFHRIRLPPILGYLLIGLMIGSFSMNFAPAAEVTREVAELGVVFLLFTIGLEFSWTRLIAMKKDVVLLGGLETLLAILFCIGVGFVVGIDIKESFLIGGVLAMSSTALVMKQLTEQVELITPYGIRSLAILIFQDLTVIPLLILIPALAGVGSDDIVSHLLQATLKAIIVVAAILIMGRYVFRPIFYVIARTRSVELFTLTTLLATLGTAYLTQQSGLSLALGAFLSGILLGETEFRHQIEADIRPFRDVLLGLFFVSIGMQIHIDVLIQFWPRLLVLFATLIVVKFIIVMLVARWGGLKWPDAFRTGLILAQGGEFGFALITLANQYKMVKSEDAAVIIGAIFLSMIIAPLLIRSHHVLVRRFFPSVKTAEGDSLISIAQLAEPLRHHVIICGFGRLGQNITRMLVEFRIPYLALDLDAPRVEKAQSIGERVSYGDASQRDVLLAAGLLNASAVVVTLNDMTAAKTVLENVRSQSHRIPIVIRTYREEESQACYEQGATIVVPEMLEASLSMGSQLLLMLKKPLSEVNRVINRIRRDRYDMFRSIIPGEETWDVDEN